MRRVATIGVYGFTLDTFVAALREAGVGVLLDVRQRRGVRGHEYAWANARRLQEELAEARVAYRHLKQLAPTTAMREAQYREDERHGIGKRNRMQLASAFRDAYLREVLDRVDLAPIVAELPDDAVGALMCVERDPEACHRSLIAARIAAEHDVTVTHLRP